MGRGIWLCVAGSQGEEVRVSLREAWVIAVQKEQTRQSREVGGTGTGLKAGAGQSLGLILRVVGTPGAMCGGRALGQCGSMASFSQPGGKWVGGVLYPGRVFRLHQSGHISWGHGDLLRFCESPRAGGRGLPW